MNKRQRCQENKQTVKYSQTTNESESGGEDNCQTINILANKKKIFQEIHAVKSTVHPSEKYFEKIRQGFVYAFSKIQFKKQLSMESLFLAVDIFDRCANKT